MLNPKAADAVRKPSTLQPPAVPPRRYSSVNCATPPTNDLEILWQQLFPSNSNLVEQKSGVFPCNGRHCCDRDSSKRRSAKRAFGDRKTNLDNAHLFGGFSSPSCSGSGASPGSGGNGRRQKQQRRRSKKSADGRLSDSRTDSASSPPASDVAAPRFTRNFDHLRLLLDAFQAVSAASGCERSESATTTNAAAADQRAPLMVLHDILHLH